MPSSVSPFPVAAPPFVPDDDARPCEPPWPTMIWPPPDAPLVGEVVTLTPFSPEEDAEPLFLARRDDVVWDHLRRPSDAKQLGALVSARCRAPSRLASTYEQRGPRDGG